jgi:hypothetical protein
MTKPRIYIAGKVGKNDFRHLLVPGLRGHDYALGPLECGTFIYTGPFFEACDHGCRHGDSTHGVLGTGCEPGSPWATRQAIWGRNTVALKAADGVFAFIETGDAYGSLVEIGMAQALGIPTKVIFGPDAPRDDMWYAAECGGRRYGAHRDLAEALKAFVAGVQR